MTLFHSQTTSTLKIKW